MNRDKEHINNTNMKHGSDDIFSDSNIIYSKSKEQVWKEIESKLESNQISKQGIFQINNNFVKAAAIFIGIIGLSLFLNFYSKTYVCPPGEHLSVLLPDNSQVELNAQSKLKYYPLKWFLNRKIIFEGEGYFSVEKGKKFEVKSDKGITTVLGTSFNIYSRNDLYNVTCITGRVKVISNINIEAILEPNHYAEINNSGQINVIKNYKTEISKSWVNNMFIFTSRPLKMVVEEIERQYNIIIRMDNNIDKYYTGFFSKEKSLEEVLDLLCKSLELTFVRIKTGEYTISKIIESE